MTNKERFWAGHEFRQGSIIYKIEKDERRTYPHLVDYSNSYCGNVGDVGDSFVLFIATIILTCNLFPNELLETTINYDKLEFVFDEEGHSTI